MRYSNVRVVARPNKKNRKPIIAACTSPSVGQVSYQALNRYGPKVGPMGWWGQSPKQPLYTNQGPNQELNCRHATTCSCNPQQAPPPPPTLAPQPTGGGCPHSYPQCPHPQYGRYGLPGRGGWGSPKGIGKAGAQTSGLCWGPQAGWGTASLLPKSNTHTPQGKGIPHPQWIAIP